MVIKIKYTFNFNLLIINLRLAHLVEQLNLDQWVAGSTPATIKVDFLTAWQFNGRTRKVQKYTYNIFQALHNRRDLGSNPSHATIFNIKTYEKTT